MDVGLEVNTEKTKYELLSCHQSTLQNVYITVAKRFFENLEVKVFGNDSNISKFNSGRN